MYTMYDEKWEPYLRNETPVARVGLVYSQQTFPIMAASRDRRRWRRILGFYQR